MTSVLVVRNSTQVHIQREKGRKGRAMKTKLQPRGSCQHLEIF